MTENSDLPLNCTGMWKKKVVQRQRSVGSVRWHRSFVGTKVNFAFKRFFDAGHLLHNLTCSCVVAPFLLSISDTVNPARNSAEPAFLNVDSSLILRHPTVVQVLASPHRIHANLARSNKKNIRLHLCSIHRELRFR